MNNDQAETVMQNVYVIGGIMYVPKYRDQGRFIGPCGKTYAAHQLRAAGAAMTTYPLLLRAGA